MLSEIGAHVGAEAFQQQAEIVNTQTPELQTHDRWGNRIDHVEFHPAYHEIMRASLSYGNHSYAWTNDEEGANADRAARFSLFAQIEPGHACPISMTHAVVPSLLGTDLEEFWVPRLTSTDYDPRLIDPAEKTAVTFGMAMTEKQGGSDVRANSTVAEPAGDHYLLTGHKWFCSAPQSDAFLVLAKLPGGDRNPFFIQRLKNKLGNKSNASSEIELNNTKGWLVGEPGAGVRTIIEMVARTRLDCVIGSTAGMRQSVAEAAWHARGRQAFGAKLIDQPLMRSVLADLQLESEAATWTMMHLAAAHDDDSSDGRAFRRIATAIAKYWICKRGPGHAYEALECLGGNGYTEDFPLARRYREQPVLAVWEGSGNVIVLDVLRAMARDPRSAQQLMAFFETGLGRHASYDARFDSLAAEMQDALAATSAQDPTAMAKLQRRGRVLVEDLAVMLQAAVLLNHAPAEIAESYVIARLGSGRGQAYGAMPEGVAIDLLVDRA
ncbi:acyl-CoA dehydrogenase family protein [Yaniella sp.]|uniref:acyl-CoA dehydrogenase family protein n=1 Tax=Yaniella sp. TaxID=2773929 RepID=UPI002647A597|nr:acyl-CoA dehydrogenase family protein [Yaniella sp.]MDN6358357.1 acyl-CoA dehydrogenase family protein [Yaniella sp.]